MLAHPLAPAGEILTERFVLDVVPAEPDAQSQTVVGKQGDIGGLPGDKRGLALGQDQDAGRKADPPGDRGEIAEHDQRIVEGLLFGVGPVELRLAVVRGAKHMVVGQ